MPGFGILITKHHRHQASLEYRQEIEVDWYTDGSWHVRRSYSSDITKDTLLCLNTDRINDEKGGDEVLNAYANPLSWKRKYFSARNRSLLLQRIQRAHQESFFAKVTFLINILTQSCLWGVLDQKVWQKKKENLQESSAGIKKEEAKGQTI